MDLTCIDPDDGQPWDFDKIEKRVKARRLVAEQKPTVLITRPMCTAFSILQNLNYCKMDPMQVKKIMNRTLVHPQF